MFTMDTNSMAAALQPAWPPGALGQAIHHAAPHRAADAPTDFHFAVPVACVDAAIMIADEDPSNVQIVQSYLQSAGYRNFVPCGNLGEALPTLDNQNPDVILLNITGSDVNGLNTLAKIRLHEQHGFTPVIVLTELCNQETRSKALRLGANDFLAKPVEPLELLPRVRNALLIKSHHDHLRRYSLELENDVRKHVAELAMSRIEVIHCLAKASEFRDNETGRHVMRVGCYAGIIARELGLDDEFVELIELAAPLHDVGKIGIPDSILMKPGKLTPDEFEIMKEHCIYGERIVAAETNLPKFVGALPGNSASASSWERVRSPVLVMAGRIATSHHEHWDGSGYPRGLAGEAIPLEGRITAVADVFDALSSARPYKKAFPIAECLELLKQGRGAQFDPRVLDAFFARLDEIIQVRIEMCDET